MNDSRLIKNIFILGVGFVIGYNYSFHRTSRGLQKCFEVNPDLKNNMAETISKTFEKELKK